MQERNVYKNARIAAGLTQERAAELLGVSVESLKAYESYRRIPSFQLAADMTVIYGAKHLSYQHIRIASGDMAVVPEVEELDLPRAALKLINRARDFWLKRDSLLDIAEDGVISETERPIYEEIIAGLDELIRAAMELKVSREVEPK